ncbi:MAG: TIGR01459 family HAD-type hydrolase [Holosporales bacterium]|jgi:HAD superfamily hydrolase (TIGR01459 family)|nr:TIGR01459 family HAD-type hydrolase [Holosporales bacterium]
MMIHKSLNDIYHLYDSFLIDVYGVIYDGRDLYPGVLDTLARIKDSGRSVVILSNMSLVASVCMEQYARKGLLQGVHYDKFISSGEAFKRTISHHIPNARSCFQLFTSNVEIFRNSNIVETQTLQEADFAYVGLLDEVRMSFLMDDAYKKNGERVAIENVTSTDVHDLAGLEEAAEILDICLQHRKPLVVVNPDIFAVEYVSSGNGLQRRPVICQGAIGEFYEKMGGQTLYFGKPHHPIYDYAMSFLDGCKKTAMVGDTPWTDILGGNMFGVDTILTLTGISMEFFRAMDPELSVEEKFDKLLETISPKMTLASLRSASQRPTHIVEAFAS